MMESLHKIERILNSEAIKKILETGSVDFNTRLTTTVYIFLFERDTLYSQRVMTDLAKRSPENPRVCYILILFALFEGQDRIAHEYIERMPKSHYRWIAEKLIEFNANNFIKPHNRIKKIDIIDDILSNTQALIDSQDWLRLFIYCELLIKDIDINSIKGKVLAPIHAYSMLKTNQKYSLGLEIQKKTSDLATLEWSSLASYIFFYDKNFDQIIDLCSLHLPKETSEYDIFYSLAFECLTEAFLRTNRKEKALELIEREIKTNGYRSWSALYKGMFEFNVDMKKGIELWRFAATDNHFCLNNSWGANSFSLSDGFRAPASSPLILGKTSSSERKITILSCADFSYAKLFSAVMLKNVIENKDVHWHFHFILTKGADLTKLIDFFLSFENVSISKENYSMHIPKAYFTIARFWVAKALIEGGIDQLIISDVDMIVKNLKKAQEIVSREKIQIGLRFYSQYHHFPWHEIMAGLVYLDGSQYCTDFLKNIVSWFEDNFDFKHRYQWWIDQVALSMATRQGDAAKYISNIDGNFLSCFEFAPNTPAGREKYANKIREKNPKLVEALDEIISELG